MMSLSNVLVCVCLFITLGVAIDGSNPVMAEPFPLLFVDRACLARQVTGQSVVCECNATYCDTITRQTPGPLTYLAYTSSQKGLRFKKTIGHLLSCKNSTNCGAATLTVEPSTLYQTVEGFGGAVTDAAGINWKLLTRPVQDHLVQSYFSPRGLEYSVARVPVGGCDFSRRPYAYNELPVNDTELTNYTLAYEDYHYKLPLLRAAISAIGSGPALQVVGTVWSPPPWMKSNNDYSGTSRLRPEFYQTYADYYLKFIEKYNQEGVPVWAITTTNEPSDGVVPLNYFNSLGWSADTMGKWILQNLGPTIRNSSYSYVKIIAGDDQRAILPYWINRMLKDEPGAAQYIDGVGVHFYSDFLTPPSLLNMVMSALPGGFLLATEACEGSFPWQRQKVVLGSWGRAYSYIHDIITDLQQGAVGWLDWNLCLDTRGGPNWVQNYVDSPVIVVPKKNLFLKQPMFYALGHFSKWVVRGSRRVEVRERRSLLPSGLEYVAFLTPRDTVVVVFYNKGSSRTVNIKLGDKMAAVHSEAKSITTVEMPYNKV